MQPPNARNEGTAPLLDSARTALDAGRWSDAKACFEAALRREETAEANR